MTWRQKALAVQHYNAVIPKPTNEELAEWCRIQFKFDQQFDSPGLVEARYESKTLEVATD